MKKKDIAKQLNIRASTIKYYTELAILPYTQAGRGLCRDYDIAKVRERIQKITQLKAKGYKIKQIVDYFKR